jgi:hypothetical protein
MALPILLIGLLIRLVTAERARSAPEPIRRFWSRHGQRFIVRADEKLTAFVELESTTSSRLA